MAARKDVIINVKFQTPGFRKFGDALKIPQAQFNKLSDGVGNFNKGIRENSTRMGRAGLAVRKATAGFRGFRMELLGVMFFGMAVQRLFKGLIQPALQMTGAMQLFSNVLGIMFLPIGLMLIDFAVALLEWWQGLSEETKNLIQKFVLIGLAVGTFLQIFGALGLGLGSIVIAFGSFIATIISALPIILAIAAGLALFGIALPSVRASTDDLNTSLEEQAGWFSRLVGWIDGLWEKLIDSEPITKFLNNMGLSEEQIEKLKNPIKTLRDTVDKLWQKIKESEAFQAVKEGIDKLQSRFEEFKQRWIWNIWPPIKDRLEDFLRIVELIGHAIGAFGTGFRFITGQESALGGTPSRTLGEIVRPGTSIFNVDITNNITPSSDVDVENLSITMGDIIIEQLNRMGFFP